ncbi:MAG: CsbD family protein [Thermoplasmatota archaeon]
MGETTNKVVGKTKKAVGRATGDRDLETEGRMQEGAGKVQGGMRKAGNKGNRAIDRIGAKVAETRRRQRSNAERPAPRTRVTKTTRTTVERV